MRVVDWREFKHSRQTTFNLFIEAGQKIVFEFQAEKSWKHEANTIKVSSDCITRKTQSFQQISSQS